LQSDAKFIAQAHTVCTKQVDKNRQNRSFTTVLEAEPPGYRHILNTIACKPVTHGTTLLPE